MKNISKEKAMSIRVPDLPVKDQRDFVARVRWVERVRLREEAEVVALDALFASLRERAFIGEL